MTSIKCPTCGFIRFASEENCKRCLRAADPNQPDISRPRAGAWRDRWWLVAHLEVPLDETCIKCCETSDVSRKPVALKAYSAWSLLTQVAGIRLFRWLDLEIPLCRRHRHGLDKLVTGMMVAGALMMVLGFSSLRMVSVTVPIGLFLTGILTIGTGIILYLIRREKVKVWKYKHPYVWLWGVHRSYLERLPNWSRQAQ